VLEPGIEEINNFTDLNVAYETETAGRGGKVTRVIFYMAGKGKKALEETNLKIYTHLDGQMAIDDFIQEFNQSVRARFWAENRPEDQETGL